MIRRAALLSLLVFACQTRATPSDRALPSESPPVAAGPDQVLDRLDSRTPLPLLPMMAHHQKQNMREHLLAVQQIVAGAATDDFEAVEKAASALGFSEQMGRMCEHMGAGAPGFTELALKFHHDADKIADAARERDGRQVLASLGQTLSQCTTCHETFKQSVVDDAAWAAARGHGP